MSEGGESAQVLVVDDNPTNLKLAFEVLRWAGYRVSTATDAEKALKVIEERPPAVILMDIGLPGMDGLTLTRKLKAQPSTRSIRIVALTAFAMKGDERKVIDAGCDGYISKPVNTRTLAAQVERYLRGELPS
jgi:CheY-like chemotaxis protein